MCNKKIVIDNKDYVIVPLDQYEKMKNPPLQITFLKEPVVVKIPFDEVNCINWDDNFLYKQYCGIIYKGKEVSVKQLIYLRDILKREYLPDHANVLIKFDNKTIDLRELDDLIKFITQHFEKIHPYKRRDVNIVLTHYPDRKCNTGIQHHQV